MITIQPVLVMPQRGRDFYTFILSVDDLLNNGRIERFGEDPNGVQRKLDEKHAAKMLDALLDNPDVFFLDNLIADLQGPWEYDAASGVLTGREGAYITIDDGSHRYDMCSQLAEGDTNLAKQWHFTVSAGLNSPYEERLARFLQQKKGKAIDTRLTLAQRERLGQLTPIEQEGWDIAMMLNTDPRSPLKGLVITEEQVVRPYSGTRGGRTVGVNITGLMSSFRSILSSRSPLRALNSANRRQVVLVYLQMVRETWPKEWASESHMLLSATGIRAMLELFTKSVAFNSLVGSDFSQESLRKALSMADSFDWKVEKHKNSTLAQLIEALDSSMSRNRTKRATRAIESKAAQA